MRLLRLIAPPIVALVLGLPCTGSAQDPTPRPPGQPNEDRPGGDYRYFTERTFSEPNRVTSSLNPYVCRDACQQDQRCRAWTWVRPNIQGPWPGCWMKDS